MAKTPSPKVLASRWVLSQLQTETVPSAETLTANFTTRINEAKREKIIEQIEKITLKLRERLQKVTDKFSGSISGGKTKKSSSAKVPTKKKK